jgi:dihydroxyacetone kinase-like protein
MKTSFILNVAESIRDAILDHESELESLDRAIGDGDHYINMKRGANAIVEMRVELESLTPDAALNKIGIKLLSTIGGASGPLLASFFMSMSKTLKEKADDSAVSYAAAFAAGVEAIQQRGKAGLGEKTMLDVLIPVAQQFSTLTASSTQKKSAHHSYTLRNKVCYLQKR